MLADISPSFTARAQVVVPHSQQQKGAATTTKTFHATRSAVVTLYAGKEIGSGSIVNREGWVITNFHVVRGVMGGEKSGWLAVKTLNGNRYPGQVVKIDRQHDLALVQLNAWKYFPTVPMATAQNIRIGQQVFAIGSPFGCPGVLTEGTLSKVRSNGDLESHLALNPGNSGGPLINLQGEMIGVNRGILQTPCGSNTGVSFATHVTVVRDFMDQLRANAS